MLIDVVLLLTVAWIVEQSWCDGNGAKTTSVPYANVLMDAWKLTEIACAHTKRLSTTVCSDGTWMLKVKELLDNARAGMGAQTTF